MTHHLRSHITALVFCLLLLVPGTHSESGKVTEFDLLITNARIVDGSGNPWFRGSIAVKDGRIARIGRMDKSSAKQIIDARGLIVAPGFIDVHAHTESIYENRSAENFIRMGVTSLITGNCGNSVIDVGEFLGRMNDQPIALNLGTLIAHGAVREEVVGLDDREVEDSEHEAMRDLVDRAMKDGAVGLSTGLIYVPGTFAPSEEVVDLARVAARHGGVYASHIRNEGTKVEEAIREAVDIGRKADIPVHISHFKLAGKTMWGKSETTIDLVKAARRSGIQVTVDQYAYTASSTSLDARLPSWAIAGGREEGTRRLEDPETRKRIVDEMKEYLERNGFEDFSFAYVADYKADPSLNGKNIAEITQLEKKTKDVDAQLDMIFEMYKTGRVQMVYQMMFEQDVRDIMKQPFAMIAADSGVRRFGSGVPHPRGYGNNARVLGRYVRDLGTITLEDAIRKMTSLPAQTFGLNHRGLLKDGNIADIVIFDEQAVADKATFEDPHQYAAGFKTVIVNGTVVFDGEKMTGKMPGRPLFGPGKYGGAREN
ncbi:MAG: D-aminoacylase [Acidobacteria bacterium]|nr:MAG: D-aminoacylase [Acidobacteriota bacterium]REJ98375.1 MAG: D-aminoacylase [Acidobacteriota bacterium]REK17119.1 MAG: D-aminoacylase [Acidobacteriota bacterium]REK43029.1 MAG: D-aminoacylase [Acidobacteriota bacterium]